MVRPHHRTIRASASRCAQRNRTKEGNCACSDPPPPPPPLGAKQVLRWYWWRLNGYGFAAGAPRARRALPAPGFVRSTAGRGAEKADAPPPPPPFPVARAQACCRARACRWARRSFSRTWLTTCCSSPPSQCLAHPPVRRGLGEVEGSANEGAAELRPAPEGHLGTWPKQDGLLEFRAAGLPWPRAPAAERAARAGLGGAAARGDARHGADAAPRRAPARGAACCPCRRRVTAAPRVLCHRDRTRCSVWPRCASLPPSKGAVPTRAPRAPERSGGDDASSPQ